VGEHPLEGQCGRGCRRRLIQTPGHSEWNCCNKPTFL
jgi:hypothetical protein